MYKNAVAQLFSVCSFEIEAWHQLFQGLGSILYAVGATPWGYGFNFRWTLDDPFDQSSFFLVYSGNGSCGFSEHTRIIVFDDFTCIKIKPRFTMWIEVRYIRLPLRARALICCPGISIIFACIDRMNAMIFSIDQILSSKLQYDCVNFWIQSEGYEKSMMSRI